MLQVTETEHLLDSLFLFGGAVLSEAVDVVGDQRDIFAAVLGHALADRLKVLPLYGLD